MLIIGVIASAAGIAITLSIDWFPAAATSQAKRIDHLYDVLLVASVPVFVLVEVVVLFCVWKFRMKQGQEEEDGPPIHGSTRLEVIWTLVPATLIAALCTYAYIVLLDIERKPAQAAGKPPELVVNVIGQQFAWTFSYDAPGQKQVVTNQLYLPAGRSVDFHVHSVDVIHDFWVPEFRLKIDAVPGITTKYRVKPDRTGDYRVVCAELCGLGHSTMRQTAHVWPAARFDAWLARAQAAAARQPS